MSNNSARYYDDLLIRSIAVVVAVLVGLHAALALLLGTRQFVAVLPWFVPTMESFSFLAGVAVAFLCLGRSRALREPSVLWVGLAFWANAILAVFCVLTWPGLADGHALITTDLSLFTWVWHEKWMALAFILAVAPVLRWPSRNGMERIVALALLVGGAAALVGGLTVAYGPSLPVLLTSRGWTPLNFYWTQATVLLFALGAILSLRRYLAERDAVFGYAALVQIVFIFAMEDALGEIWGYWWYLQRVLQITALSIILFGLLSEYVMLYRRERDRAAELEALGQLMDPTLGRHGLEPLLKGLLERMVSLVGAGTGILWLLDPDHGELVCRKAAGIPQEQIARCPPPKEKSLAGSVVSRKAIVGVRDVRADSSLADCYSLDRGVRGALAAPLFAGDEVIGVAEVDFPTPREFTAHEERLLGVIAERASLALQQARLLEETEEQRNRLQVLVDTAPIGIAFYSAPEGRLLLFNKAAEATVGRRALEAGVSRVDAQRYFYTPDGEPYPVEELPVNRALGGNPATGVELLLRRTTGGEMNVLMNSAPLRDARGAIVGAVVAFLDITPIKEQEHLRDEFITAAAHELRTPVTSIKGYAQLLSKLFPGEAEPRVAKAFEAINQQCDRIAARVQEMLEVLLYRTSPPELHKARFDLGELTSRAVKQVESAENRHRFSLQREAQAPVDGDEERIDEVVVALLDSAVRYCTKGGEVQVRVWAQDGEAMVSVRDQEVEIPPERQSHLFEPFYEPIPPGASGYRSVVPLNLYLSKLIVERHKGHLWFESREGKGSTFCLSLPMAERSSSS